MKNFWLMKNDGEYGNLNVINHNLLCLFSIPYTQTHKLHNQQCAVWHWISKTWKVPNSNKTLSLICFICELTWMNPLRYFFLVEFVCIFLEILTYSLKTEKQKQLKEFFLCTQNGRNLKKNVFSSWYVCSVHNKL